MRKFFSVAAVAVLAPALALFGYLGSFMRYVADDFCAAAIVRSHGLLGSQVYWYNSWSGRFSFSFFAGIAGLIGPSRFFPAVLLIGWLAAATWSIKQIIGSAKWPNQFWISLVSAGVVIFAVLSSLDNIGQSFYWQTGALTYISPLIFWTIYVGIVGYGLRQKPGRSFWLIILSGVSLFIAGGFSEVAAFVQIGGLLGAAAIVYLDALPQTRRQFFRFLLSGFIGSVLAMTVVVLAPGNAIRESFLSSHPGLGVILKYSIKLAVLFFESRWAVYAPFLLLVLALGIFLALYVNYYRREKIPAFPKNRYGWLLIPLLGFGLVVMCNIPALYALYFPLPSRAFPVPDFIIIVALGYWAYAVVDIIIAKSSTIANKVPYIAFAGAVALAAAILYTGVISLRDNLPMVRDARAGAAISDENERLIRSQHDAHKQDITVKPLPDNLFTAGVNRILLSADPDSDANKCAASYYGVHSIKTGP